MASRSSSCLRITKRCYAWPKSLLDISLVILVTVFLIKRYKDYTGQLVMANHHTTKLITRNLHCEPDLFLVVLVTSDAWKGYERRLMIRETWGPYNKSRQTFFLVGSQQNAKTTYHLKAKTASLRSEKLLYKDIIEGNFKERFKNLPYKLQAGFEWVHLYCPKTSFVLKTDDETFINTKTLFPILNTLPTTNLYTGKVRKNVTVNRDKKRQYVVTNKEYPDKIYPDFVSGTSMIFTSDVVSRLVAIIPQVKVFKLDDVYIGILVKKLGIKVTDIDSDSTKDIWDVFDMDERCTVLNTTVVKAVYFKWRDKRDCIYKMFEDSR